MNKYKNKIKFYHNICSNNKEGIILTYYFLKSMFPKIGHINKIVTIIELKSTKTFETTLLF